MDISDDELRAFALALCVELNVKVTGAESLDYLLDAITIRALETAQTIHPVIAALKRINMIQEKPDLGDIPRIW